MITFSTFPGAIKSTEQKIGTFGPQTERARYIQWGRLKMAPEMSPGSRTKVHAPRGPSGGSDAEDGLLSTKMREVRGWCFKDLPHSLTSQMGCSVYFWNRDANQPADAVISGESLAPVTSVRIHLHSQNLVLSPHLGALSAGPTLGRGLSWAGSGAQAGHLSAEPLAGSERGRQVKGIASGFWSWRHLPDFLPCVPGLGFTTFLWKHEAPHLLHTFGKFSSFDTWLWGLESYTHLDLAHACFPPANTRSSQDRPGFSLDLQSSWSGLFHCWCSDSPERKTGEDNTTVAGSPDTDGHGSDSPPTRPAYVGTEPLGRHWVWPQPSPLRPTSTRRAGALQRCCDFTGEATQGERASAGLSFWNPDAMQWGAQDAWKGHQQMLWQTALAEVLAKRWHFCFF